MAGKFPDNFVVVVVALRSPAEGKHMRNEFTICSNLQQYTYFYKIHSADVFIQKSTYNTSKNKDGGGDLRNVHFCRISCGHGRFSRDLKVLLEQNGDTFQEAFKLFERQGITAVRVAALRGGRFPGLNPAHLQKQLCHEWRRREIKEGSEVNLWQERREPEGFQAQTPRDTEDSRTNAIKASPSAVSVILSPASTSCLRLRDNDTKRRSARARVGACTARGVTSHSALGTRAFCFLFCQKGQQ